MYGTGHFSQASTGPCNLAMKLKARPAHKTRLHVIDLLQMLSGKRLAEGAGFHQSGLSALVTISKGGQSLKRNASLPLPVMELREHILNFVNHSRPLVIHSSMEASRKAIRQILVQEIESPVACALIAYHIDSESIQTPSRDICRISVSQAPHDSG